MRSEKKEMQPIIREYTLNLHKATHDVVFKKRAARAMATIRKFAQKEMGTEDVRLDSQLNKYVWSKGVHNIPKRIRVRCERIVNDKEEDGKTFYTVVKVLDVPHFHGLTTTVATD